MVNLKVKQCCGCAACEDICPVEAIEMKEDSNGFIFAVANPEKCISCGLCDKTCSYKVNPAKYDVQKVFAAKSKDKYTKLTTSSGGLASILSEWMVKSNGVVYGCRINSVNDISHIRCTTLQDIESIKGSKYVQSHTWRIYRKVKEDLANCKVLFIGTPCQIAALRLYLKREYDNLFTVDIVCHGVPSKKILEDYVSSKFNIKKGDLSTWLLRFRWKTIKNNSESIHFGFKLCSDKNKNERTLKRIDNAYMSAFFNGYTYRDYCHDCQFACSERMGDVTLGDFWGLGKQINTSLDVSLGVSLVMQNTAKGKYMIDAISPLIDIEEHTLEEASRYNQNLTMPSQRPNDKNYFLELMKDKGLEYAVMKLIPSYRKERSVRHRIYLFLAKRIQWIKKSKFLVDDKN